MRANGIMNRPANWIWPLWGVGAGVLGAIGHLFTLETPGNDATTAGSAFISELNHTTYHVGIVAGLFAAFCVLAFAAGWRRWAAGTGRESLMTELVGLAVVASAGAMLLGYGFKGSLAVYLPGGSDYPYVTNDALMSVYMFNDFGPFIAWWGIQMATVGIAWVALRERVLPRWLGAVAAVFAVLPMILLFAVGLPGFPGVTHPFWMIVNGVALTLVLRRATRMAAQATPIAHGASAAATA